MEAAGGKRRQRSCLNSSLLPAAATAITLKRMDSKHLILKEDDWINRLKASGEDNVTAYPNLIGHAREGWLASYREEHRTCLLTDSNYELVAFGSRAESDDVAFDQIKAWLETRSLSRFELLVMLHD